MDNTQTRYVQSGLRHYSLRFATTLRAAAVATSACAAVVIPLFVAAMSVITFTLERNENWLAGLLIGFAAVVIGVGIVIRLSNVILGSIIVLLVSALIAAALLCGAIYLHDPTFHDPWHAIPYATDDQNLNMVIDGMLICAASLVATGIGYAIFFLAASLTLFRTIEQQPEIIMVQILAMILHALKQSSKRLGDSPTKAGICSQLEVASMFLQDRIPESIDPPASIAREKLDERCYSGAWELRQMQASVALVDENVADILKQKIVGYIEVITHGKYGMLPTGAPSTAKEEKTHLAIRLTKSLPVAFIPAGCLIGARLSGLKVSGPPADWLAAVAISWAAITLISALDPLYKSKLKEIRSIISAIRPDRE